MKRILFIVVALVALTLAFSNTSYAQPKKKTVQVYGQKGDGGVKVSGPGDEKPRDKNAKRGSCFVYFDNYQPRPLLPYPRLVGFLTNDLPAEIRKMPQQ